MATDHDILAIATPEIAQEEHFCPHAVADPLSHGEPWTVGYGATGPHITRDTVWTRAQAIADLDARLPVILRYYDAQIPWWRTLDAPRAAVLVSMGYNMGEGFIHTWPHFIAKCQAHDWRGAHDHMLNPPTWLDQVHTRATTLAQQMLTGIYVA